MKELIIDCEFAGQIPPLTEEELRQLEDNILSDKEVINPIIIWNGISAQRAWRPDHNRPVISTVLKSPALRRC